ncbi:putative transcriptional regulator [Caenibius tardaugens NBRC 16725]|uniref:Putative transcriptional regulator n=1 Tax=Caenibius tardaugens NBRC 16725 TaxID=1219035 RepID=U2YHX4_9SPHN|nr:TetR/AcrR family transcriptional regulator [Caenibius tardaugens]AZI37166.1 TetR/AcrR family transcriptional regulator [Caenibius tardaugens NBRC 16725]GAD47592.1 putative transcriptional regulator [Caenibius tardaugens NBRC 16725]
MTRPASIEQILSAASELFATRGYARTTMSQVAAAAGVSKGLPYVYFPSKQELLDGVHLRAVDRWLKATLAHLNEDNEPAILSLKKAFKYSILYSAGDPICRAIMAQDSNVVLPDSERVRDEIRRLNDEGFRRLLSEAINEGSVRDDLDLDTLILMWRATHDTLIHAQKDKLSWVPKRKSLEDLVDSAIEVLFNGITPRQEAPAQARQAV